MLISASACAQLRSATVKVSGRQTFPNYLSRSVLLTDILRLYLSPNHHHLPRIIMFLRTFVTGYAY